MRKYLIGILILLVGYSYGWSQSNGIPMNDFYKMQFLYHSQNEVHENLFPANESQVKLDSLIQDPTIFYSSFTGWFFQKHWIQGEINNAKVYVSPLVDLSYVQDITRKDKMMYRNTRGGFIKGSIGDKFTFLFSFAENQARFLDYQDTYFGIAGERYVKKGGYSRQNAVIPTGSRTKPYKTDAFDYAYSIGMVNFQVNKHLRFELGNQPNFVGVGYRSLLLSDHSINAFGLRTIYKINDKFSYQWLIKNHKNLYRKPLKKYVESPFENKMYSAVYFTYKPVKSLAISLFSAANALRADSMIRHKVQWQSLMPLPVINTDIAINNKIMNGIMGLNLEWSFRNYRIYGQLAFDKIGKKMEMAGQFGMYYFDAFTIKNWMIQLEGNYVPNGFYTDDRSKLSYTHAQLPLAHPVGHNFAEIIFRTQYEWKRIYANITFNMYRTLSPDRYGYLYDNTLITENLEENIDFLPDGVISNGNVQNLNVEIGWRYNRKYNGMFYFSYQYHSNYIPLTKDKFQVQTIMIGWKTGLFNQYLDF